ncbi:MAG: PD-(D/E)XK nuclease family protein [Phycisphaerae bacterium]|nr:PD-(D/E)XK nuclease family protein [Phycisphaerae bacterium]
MEPSGRQDELLERLLASDARAVLLHGPAGCGKTSVSLEVYRRCAPAGEIPSAWLLAPNDATARALQRRLLASTAGGVLLQSHIMTFDSLAGRILSAAGGKVRRVGSLRRRLLLRRIVRELHAAGELKALSPVVDTPGLITALQRNISELKRATADPDELTRRVGSPQGPAGDMLRVYRAYQQALNDQAACDAEGQAWLARDILRDQSETNLSALGLENLQTLIVDGFTDFTPTQLEILALLQPKLARLVITLPLPDEKDGRERLWQWTKRTHTRLRETLGGELQEIALSGWHGLVFVGMDGSEEKTCPRRRVHATPLHSLSQNVFRYDVVSDQPAGFDVIAAGGMETEVQEVGRRIKRLLLSGETGGVGVLARDIEPYRPVIERVFRQMRIPVLPAETTLAQTPVVQFSFAVVDLAKPSGVGKQPPFAFPKILRVLRNSYFSPEALGEFDTTTVHHAEMIIRRGNVLTGRDACARAVERLAQQANRRTDPEEESAVLPADEDALRKAGALLEALFDLSERSGTPAGYLAMLETLQLTRVVRRQDSPEGVARDLRAIDTLRRSIVNLAETLSMDSADDLDALREALAEISLPGPRSESVVDVLNVLDARAMRWDHVFLLGCDEGQFPQRFTDSSLLGEADRRAWRDAGVRLDLRADLTAREMLLFYLAVSRAEKRLTISYRKSDAAGRAGAPGAFLQALVDAFGGFDALRDAGALLSPAVGQFIPPPRDIATDNEALAATVAETFQRDGENSAGIQSNDARLPRVLLGARTLQRRWEPGPCGVYDGRLSDSVLLEKLHRDIPARTIFSAGQLSTYNQCPWRYFAKYLLNLKPLESPRRELEAVRRGLFCHNVLFATLSSLAESQGRPLAITRIEPDTLLDAFEKAFDAEAKRIEARQPVYPALWDIQREQMRAQLREYLLSQQADGLFSPECLRFELSFGRPDDSPEGMDPASTPEPVEIQTSAGKVRFCGRIDRVDRVRTSVDEGLFVVDYKTGRLPGVKETVEGRNTQMPLYTLAVESLLGETALGGAFHSLAGDRPSFFAAVKVYRGNVKEEESYGENLEAALEAVGGAVEGIAAGRFDLLPTKDACDYCDYRRVCHFSPARDELRRMTAGEAAK